MVHLKKHPHMTISKLVPWSALILSSICCVIFLVKTFILEGALMKRFYGKQYAVLSETNRRGFVNHHMQAAIRILLFIMGIYPFFAVAFGKSLLSDPFIGKRATMGDMLLICSQLLVSMYILDLFYRTAVSPVSALHHLGTIIVAQVAVSLSIGGHKDAVYEFVLCCVWGAFDVIAEFMPNIAIILYRTRPDEYAFLRKLFYWSAATSFAGTVAETIVAMWLFGALWDKWDLGFKVATPFLHCAFAAAQLHGSRNLLGLARRMEKKLREAEKGTDIESVPSSETLCPRASDLGPKPSSSSSELPK